MSSEDKNIVKRGKTRHPFYGRHIEHQAKHMAYNVYLYFKARKRDKSTWEYETDVNLHELVAKVTRLTAPTVRRITREGELLRSQLKEGEEVVFKPKEKQKRNCKRYNVDNELLKKHIMEIRAKKHSNNVPFEQMKELLLAQGFKYDCPDKYLQNRIRTIMKGQLELSNIKPNSKKRRVKSPTPESSSENENYTSDGEDLEVTVKEEIIENEVVEPESLNEIFIKTEQEEVKVENETYFGEHFL